MKKDVIRWLPKEVKVADVKPTPNNYKIKTDLGKERLALSLKMFGLAGTVVVNTDLSLIDGNSRLIEAKERGDKKIWVSVPNRKLTPAEYKEMSAMYDYAKAGEVDVDRIHNELGSKEDFFTKWNITVPMELLAKMGKGADTKKLAYPEQGEKALEVSDIIMVQAFFTNKQEEEFRKMEIVLKKEFKVTSSTDVIFKAVQKCYKASKK